MDIRAFGSWMSAPKCLFSQDFEGLTEVFAPGRPPGCPCARPQDIRPQNLLFGLLFFVPEKLYPSMTYFFFERQPHWRHPFLQQVN